MSSSHREARRQSFGQAVPAHTYHRVRPSYPQSALLWALDSSPGHMLHITDIGCGTGILSAQMRELGHAVVGLEPAAQMRLLAAEQVPVSSGTAEATGLAAGSVDVATFGQSWHWVDVAAASAELDRVITRSGHIVALSNAEQFETTSVGAAIAEVLSPLHEPVRQGASSAARLPDPMAPWQPWETQDFAWQRTFHTSTEVTDLLSTWSWIAVSDQRDSALRAVGKIVDDHLMHHPTGFQLDYVCSAYRSWRR